MRLDSYQPTSGSLHCNLLMYNRRQTTTKQREKTMTKMTVSELCATIVKTFKAIATFTGDYTTDERAANLPETELFNLMDYFDRLMEAHATVTIFPANTKDEMLNAFFIADINAVGLDAAIADYNNGTLPTFTPS